MLKISIIIPSFNQGKYLEQTILSVINQGYSRYELIIIDGASTDNSVEIIKKYESNLSYWVSEPDKGQADAINKGFKKATGDIFNWLNSDDFLEYGTLREIGIYFSKNPKKQVLCGYTNCFFDQDKRTSHCYRMGLKRNVMDTILNVQMNQPGTFYRTNIVKSLGGVNKSLNYIFDNELWFRYLCKYGIENIGLSDKIFAHFRLHDSSKSVHDGYQLFEKESQAIWKWLAIKYNIPEKIKSLLNQEESSINYLSNQWEGTFFDVIQFENYLASKYMLPLCNLGENYYARNGFIYGIRKRKLKFSRLTVSVFFKIFIFPGFFKSK